MFAGANMAGAQIIALNEGEVNYNKICNEKPKQTLSETKITDTLNELMVARKEDNTLLFTEKSQWFAVYRVLCIYANYPNQMKAFEKKMNNLGFNQENKLTYESLSHANRDVPLLATTSPETWDSMKDKNKQYEKQYDVAEFLMCRLGIKS